MLEKRHSHLHTWDTIPPWYRNNEYIHSGYRATSQSYIKSIQSIFSLHNETVNIYSHLLGSILFTTLPFVIYGSLRSRYATASYADVVVFSTFFFGVAVCFSLSTIYHTFNNHSERTYALFSQLDFIGIVILIWGCTLPSIYYGFYCDPSHQLKYYILVSVLASSCIYITQHSSFRQPRYRHHRALVYSGLAFSFVGPIIHGIIEFGWETQMRRMSLDWMALMGTLNICGAALYALRIPERWYPRRFDTWGSSHQLMHCLVVSAGIAHLFGLLRAFDHVHSQENICGGYADVH